MVTKTRTNQKQKYDDHSNRYTILLDSYIENASNANKLKNRLKGFFFAIIMLIMLALTIAFILSVFRTFDIIKSINSSEAQNWEGIIGAVASILPIFATMLVSLIELPRIIAKYLFNPKEERSMTHIISKIQNHDVKMYSIDNELEHLLMRNSGASTDIEPKGYDDKISEPEDIIL